MRPATAFALILCASIGTAAVAATCAAQDRAGARASLRDRALGIGERGTTLPLPPGTQVRRDIAYGPHADQRFDIYLPPAPRDAPVLLMVHGGGWKRGDKASPGVAANKVAHWGPKGWIVVSANNRLVPDATPLEQAGDIARATAEVQRLAPGWGGDPARVVLMGHSAGAHLVALVGADPALLQAAGARPVRGVVTLDSAAMDVPATMARPPLPDVYENAFGDDPADWRAASPLHRLRRGAPPMLSVCSSRRLQPCPQSRDFARAAAAVGTTVEVMPVDLSHAGANRDLGLPSRFTSDVDAFMARVVR